MGISTTHSRAVCSTSLKSTLTNIAHERTLTINHESNLTDNLTENIKENLTPKLKKLGINKL